jgi:hypothetical protein
MHTNANVYMHGHTHKHIDPTHLTRGVVKLTNSIDSSKDRSGDRPRVVKRRTRDAERETDRARG